MLAQTIQWQDFGIENFAAFNRRIKSGSAEIAKEIEKYTEQEVLIILSVIADLKRMVELYCGDPDFRDALHSNAEDALRQSGLNVAMDDALCFMSYQSSETSPTALTRNLRYLQKFLGEGIGGGQAKVEDGESTDANYRAWYGRQLASLQFYFPPGSSGILRPTFAFELSHGCSVGCAFCGVAAPKLSDLYLYTSENAQQWCQILENIKSRFGSAAGTSILFWATDPLDNPDYERFVADTLRITGVNPPTTTALPTRDSARTKNILKESLKQNNPLNRFSVLSVNSLRKLFRKFTAAELLFVPLVLQAPEALLVVNYPRTAKAMQIKSGRLFDRTDIESVEGTIACVVGFIVSMVKQTIQLVTPRPASPRWPLGYVVIQESTFETAADLTTLVDSMIAEHMPTTVRSDRVVRFEPGLRYSELLNGFQLKSDWHVVANEDQFALSGKGLSRELGQLIHAGIYTPAQIVDKLVAKGWKASIVQRQISEYFDGGLLTEAEV